LRLSGECAGSDTGRKEVKQSLNDLSESRGVIAQGAQWMVRTASVRRWQAVQRGNKVTPAWQTYPDKDPSIILKKCASY